MYLHFQSLDDYSLDALAILSLPYNLDFRCIFYGTFTFPPAACPTIVCVLPRTVYYTFYLANADTHIGNIHTKYSRVFIKEKSMPYIAY